MKSSMAPILVLLFVAAGSVTSHAEGSGVNVGVKSGLNGSDIITNGIDSSPRFTLGGGVFLTIPLGKFGLQPEVMYLPKGYNVDGVDLTVKLDYLEVPLLLRYNLSSKGAVTSHLLFGPALCVSMSAKNSWDDDLEAMARQSYLDAVVGLGVTTPLAAGRLGFEGRASVGITDTWDTDHEQVIDGDRNINCSLFAVYTLF